MLTLSTIQEFVREVATLTGLPQQCEFIKSKRGINDVAIFDFSKYVVV